MRDNDDTATGFVVGGLCSIALAAAFIFLLAYTGKYINNTGVCKVVAGTYDIQQVFQASANDPYILITSGGESRILVKNPSVIYTNGAEPKAQLEVTPTCGSILYLGSTYKVNSSKETRNSGGQSLPFLFGVTEGGSAYLGSAWKK